MCFSAGHFWGTLNNEQVCNEPQGENEAWPPRAVRRLESMTSSAIVSVGKDNSLIPSGSIDGAPFGRSCEFGKLKEKSL